MKTVHVRLPAFLASALINGDTSGLDDMDRVHYANALEYLEGGHVVDVGEPFFSWTCDLPGFHMGADMANYTVLYHKE